MLRERFQLRMKVKALSAEAKACNKVATERGKVTYKIGSDSYGQTAAMQAGFDFAKGDVIVTIDGDLQNDPADIPLLLAHMEKTGVDVVSGWRKKRARRLRIRLQSSPRQSDRARSSDPGTRGRATQRRTRRQGPAVERGARARCPPDVHGRGRGRAW